MKKVKARRWTQKDLREMSSYARFVDDLACRAFGMIHKETNHFSPSAKWFIIGRVVSRVFWEHFHTTYAVAQKDLLIGPPKGGPIGKR